MHIDLAHWEWLEETTEASAQWTAPGSGDFAALDLRPLPEQAQAGGPPGTGIFQFVDDAQPRGRVAPLGRDWEVALDASQRAAAADILGFSLSTLTTPRSLVWELFTTRADPSGQSAAKPLRAALGRRVRCTVAGILVIDEAPTAEDVQRTVEVFRADYLRHRAYLESLQDSRMAEEYYRAMRRFTATTSQRLYGRMDDETARSILPSQHQGDGWERPSTALYDSFDRGDSTDLNASDTGKEMDEAPASWDWSESGNFSIVSNTCRNAAGETGTWARIDQDLSSDSHFMQTPMDINVNSATRFVGPTTRFASGAVTYYLGGPMASSSQFQEYALKKIITGTMTSIGTTSGYTDGAESNVTVKLESDASDGHTVSANGAGRHGPTTDTSITGNLRVGLHADAAGAGRNIFYEIAAEDTGGAGPVTADGGVTLPALAASGAGEIPVTATGTITIPALVAAGTGTAATPSASYLVEARDLSTGDLIAQGWTERPSDEGIWDVADYDVTGYRTERVIRQDTTTGDVTNNYNVAKDEHGSFTTETVQGATSVASQIGIGYKAITFQSASTDGYGVVLASDLLRVYDMDTFSVLDEYELGQVVGANEWWNIRAEYVPSTHTIRGKAWPDLTAEPGSWQLDYEDGSALHTPAYVCLGCRFRSQRYYYRWFGVGIGEAAPLGGPSYVLPEAVLDRGGWTDTSDNASDAAVLAGVQEPTLQDAKSPRNPTSSDIVKFELPAAAAAAGMLVYYIHKEIEGSGKTLDFHIQLRTPDGSSVLDEWTQADVQEAPGSSNFVPQQYFEDISGLTLVGGEQIWCWFETP